MRRPVKCIQKSVNLQNAILRSGRNGNIYSKQSTQTGQEKDGGKEEADGREGQITLSPILLERTCPL